MNKIYDYIIIGGGAAGLFAGAALTDPGQKLILEGNKTTGIKMLMSGSGQCNITHDGNIKDFTAAFGPNGKKIRSCLYKHSNEQLRTFLEKLGIKTVARPDGKIFPETMDAHTIVDGLIAKAISNGFQIKTSCKVTSITHNLELFTIEAGGGKFVGRKVIVATGGCSYPTSGSDGAMLEILNRDLEIPVVPPTPALVPIKVENYGYSELSGISFDKAKVAITEASGKFVAFYEAPLLLTHSEFSGPAILDISRYAKAGKKLVINYVNMSLEDARAILNDAVKSSKAGIENIVCDAFHIPRRFAATVVARVGHKTIDIAKALTSDTYLISGTSGFSRAMVTCGGIELDTVNPKTMESKEIPNLYFIGEVLDIDGRSGGYNLQFAYSSAMAAVSNIQRK